MGVGRWMAVGGLALAMLVLGMGAARADGEAVRCGVFASTGCEPDEADDDWEDSPICARRLTGHRQGMGRRFLSTNPDDDCEGELSLPVGEALGVSLVEGWAPVAQGVRPRATLLSLMCLLRN